MLNWSSSISAYAVACTLCSFQVPSLGGFPLFSSTGIMPVSWHSSLSILPFSPNFSLCILYSVLIFGVSACQRFSPFSPFCRKGIILLIFSCVSNFTIGAASWYALASGMFTFLSAFECFMIIVCSSFVKACCNCCCMFSGFSVFTRFSSSFEIVSCSLCFIKPSIITSFGGSSSCNTYVL